MNITSRNHELITDSPCRSPVNTSQHRRNPAKWPGSGTTSVRWLSKYRYSYGCLFKRSVCLPYQKPRCLNSCQSYYQHHDQARILADINHFRQGICLRIPTDKRSSRRPRINFSICNWHAWENTYLTEESNLYQNRRTMVNVGQVRRHCCFKVQHVLSHNHWVWT